VFLHLLGGRYSSKHLSFVMISFSRVADDGRWSRMIKRYQKLRGSEATDRPRSSWNGMQIFDRQAGLVFKFAPRHEQLPSAGFLPGLGILRFAALSRHAERLLPKNSRPASRGQQVKGCWLLNLLAEIFLHLLCDHCSQYNFVGFKLVDRYAAMGQHFNSLSLKRHFFASTCLSNKCLPSYQRNK